MGKDPAALFYIDKWLVATKGMKADCRGWFLNLILHQFDKGELPNDIEELANYADVRISEYKRFKQMYEQVLKQKFKVNDRGNLENAYASEILRARELFKEKRENAGKLSYFLKYVRKFLCADENIISKIKPLVNLATVDVKNSTQIEQVFEDLLNQVLKQEDKLLINETENKNENNISTLVESNIGNSNHTLADMQGKKLIIQEMANIWKTSRPDYVIDPLEDYHEFRAIAEKIGSAAKVTYESKEGLERICDLFNTLVTFSNSHALFKDYQVSQFRKYFNNIASACKSQRNQNKNGTPPNSVVHQNVETAELAKSILKQKRKESDQSNTVLQ